MAVEIVKRDANAPLAERPADPRLQLTPEAGARRLGISTLGAVLSFGAIAHLAATVWSPIVLFAPVPIGFLLWRQRRFNQRIVAAVEALDRGDIDAATAAFLDMAMTGSPATRALAVQNLGYVALRAGDYDRALALFSEVYRAAPSSTELRRACADGLATTFALQGNRPAARYWLGWGPHPADNLPTTEALVHTRFGDFERVVTMRMLPLLTGSRRRALDHELRLFFALRAFARASVGEPYDRVHDDLTRVHVRHPHELDYLVDDWPELAAFLARHPAEPTRDPARAALPEARVVTRHAT